MKKLLMLAALFLSACVTPSVPLGHQPSSQSWDQANLKANDHGCPTAIFVAPGGNLTQCEPVTVTVSPEASTVLTPEQAAAIAVFLITGKQPPTHVAPVEYNTPEAAATAGLALISSKPTSSYYEWGGLIAKTPTGKYIALPANTSITGDEVSISGNNGFAENGEVIGTYHTHPCLPKHDGEYFSPNDLMEAIFAHNIVFMGDLCTGHVHEFKPGDKPDVEMPTPMSGVKLTKGRIVGTFTAPRPMLVVE